MLRWKLDNTAKSIAELLGGLPKADPYALPKETDGLPDHWAFAPLTHYQFTVSNIRRALHEALSTVRKGRDALTANDIPAAIHCAMTAQDQLWSSRVGFSSAPLVRMWRYIDKRRRRLADHAAKGNKERAKYSADERAIWRGLWRELKARNPRLNKSSAALFIQKRRGLPKSAVSSIRHELE